MEVKDYKGWKCSALTSEVGMEVDCTTVQDAFEAGQFEGRKEVVNWFRGYDKEFPNQREYKAKLKEWKLE